MLTLFFYVEVNWYIPCTIFQRCQPEFAMQNHVSCVLRPDKLGGVLKEKSCFFFILLTEHRLNRGVFIIIGWISKMWIEDILGHSEQFINV